MIALLNFGFERGGEVPRCERIGDAFITRRFAVYCPKAIAGINSLPRTLHTRVFQIQMPKRKHDEQIDEFEPDRLNEWAERTRDDHAIFALRNAGKVAEMYERRSKLFPRSDKEDGRPVTDDRLRDILAPLYAIAAVIDREAGCPVATPGLDQFAEVQAGLRHSDDTEDDIAMAVHALFEWAIPRWEHGKVLMQVPEAIQLFKSAQIGWATEPARAKSLLRKLGGENKPDWWMGKTTRGYVYYEADLTDLVERYPIAGVPACPKEKR